MADPKLEGKLQAQANKLNMTIEEIMAVNEILYTNSEGQDLIVKELLQTQQALQLALKAAQMGIWEWDLSTNKITWSDGLEPLHGLKSGEFEKLYGGNLEGFRKLIHPDDRDLLTNTVAQSLKEKIPYHIEFRVVWPDGSIHWMGGQGKGIYDENGNALRMLGIGMDITERKQAEGRLRQSEERFRVAIKHAPILVFNHDKNLKYTWFYNNASLSNSEEWILGKTDADIFLPSEAIQMMAVKRHVLESGTGAQIEIRMTMASKVDYYLLTVEPLYEEGIIAGITCAAINITERKKQEDELRRSERLKQEIFENSADALFLVNAQNNSIEDYNQQAVLLFGYKDKQELIGKHSYSLQKHPYTKAEVRKILREIYINKSWTAEVEYVSKTGREFWGNAAITLISVDSNQYYLIRIRDITERKIAEAAIIRSQQEILLEKQKTEEALAVIEKDNLRKTKELEEARELQLSMLPQNPPEVEHLDVAMYMKTCVEVGGDYYDYKIDDQGTITFILGDATGHGLRAGIVVATVKSYFQTLANQCTVSELLEKISEGIQNLQIRGMYMGVTVIKIKNNHLTVASSGMPPLYLYQHQQKTVEQIVLKGLFLGSTIPFPYQYTCISLEPGDALLAMTDGLPELFDTNRKMLEYERIEQCLKNNAHLPASEIIHALTTMADTWTADKENEDDIALLIIKAK